MSGSPMKAAVIGGGSTYTPELIRGLAERAKSFRLTELWLMDIAAERLAVVGGLAQRMVASRGSPFRVVLTADLAEAIRGASYVITQLRVGGMAARREDEYLGHRHGLIGQETTGVGGLAKALRSIPVILEVARTMHDMAPGALLLNFTNPSGLIAEALARHAPAVPAVGVCNIALTTKMALLGAIGAAQGGDADPERAELDTLGLNHLSWHRSLRLDGADLWPQVLEAYLRQLRASPEPEWDPQEIASLGMIPNSYLHYYHHTERKLAEQQAWPPSRAEQVIALEEGLLRRYAERDRTEPPEELMQRGGAYYSTVVTQLLDAHHNNLGKPHVVSVRHGGAVSGWPADWVLEMPCQVDSTGIHPLPAQPLPPAPFELLVRVKEFELLAVEAAVHGDRAAARRALLAHPLGPGPGRVQAVLDDLLRTHRRTLPQFWDGRP